MSEKQRQKHEPHIEPCPFCGSTLLDLWDNEEEVKEALTKPLPKGEPRRLLDYCAGIFCNSCGANVQFYYETPNCPIEPYNANEARECVADSWNKRDTGITFFEFMMRYLKKDSRAGDLARDMDRDKANFPRSNTRDVIMSYLQAKCASHDCFDTLVMCYKRYMRYKQRHDRELE